MKLVCPHCSGSLWVETETVGRPYLTYDTPSAIECEECEARWSPTGEPVEPPRWERYPNLYRKPATV